MGDPYSPLQMVDQLLALWVSRRVHHLSTLTSPCLACRVVFRSTATIQHKALMQISSGSWLQRAPRELTSRQFCTGSQFKRRGGMEGATSRVGWSVSSVLLLPRLISSLSPLITDSSECPKSCQAYGTVIRLDCQGKITYIFRTLAECRITVGARSELSSSPSATSARPPPLSSTKREKRALVPLCRNPAACRHSLSQYSYCTATNPYRNSVLTYLLRT